MDWLKVTQPLPLPGFVLTRCRRRRRLLLSLYKADNVTSIVTCQRDNE